MDALHRKVESLQADLDELRKTASSDSRAALERAFSLEVAVQDAKAAAQIARLQKDQEIAQIRRNLESDLVLAKEQLSLSRHLNASLQATLDEERETHRARIATLKEQLARLRHILSQHEKA